MSTVVIIYCSIIAGGVIIFIAGYSFGEYKGIRSVRRQAIKNSVAEWLTNSYGDPFFTWKKG